MGQFWPATPDDSGWITPTLVSGWAAPGGTLAPLRYRRVSGVVEFQGSATGAADADPLFTLPTGFRPDVPTGTDMVFRVNSSISTTATTRVVVRGNGTINVIGGTTPVFDMVRFRTAA